MPQLTIAMDESDIFQGWKRLFISFATIITVKYDTESFDSAQVLARFIRQLLIGFIGSDKSFDSWLFCVYLSPDNGCCSFMCKMKYPRSFWHRNYGIQHACNMIFSYTPHYSLIRPIGEISA